MVPPERDDDLTLSSDSTGAVGPASRPADTGPLSPGQAFGARYHILRLFGMGGMGAVYQAWDQELGRRPAGSSQ